jgi:pilus assembly protein Flp/PilA
MGRMLLAFGRREDGATAIEYGLIAALIALAVVLAMTTLGASLQGMFNYTSNRATTVWDQPMP